MFGLQIDFLRPAVFTTLLAVCVFPRVFAHELEGVRFLGMTPDMTIEEKKAVLEGQDFVCYTQEDHPNSQMFWPGYCLTREFDKANTDTSMNRMRLADVRFLHEGYELHCDVFVDNCKHTRAVTISQSLSSRLGLDLYQEIPNFNEHRNYVCDHDLVGNQICFLPSDKSLRVLGSGLKQVWQ